MSRKSIIRSSLAAQEFIVQLDGSLQEGAAPPPSTPEAILETEDAADLVEEARRRADELIASASTELADVRAEGFRLGHDAGYHDGMTEARAELADALALVQAAGLEGKSVRDDIIATAEHEIIELVISAVRTVVGELVRVDESFVLHTIERAMQRLANQNIVRVRVNPQDASIASATLDTRGGSMQPFEVLGDGTIAVGGCVIDTAAGEVDARLDGQIEAVARSLRTAVPDVA